mmetsp:Transcript_16713/g.52265  ORF Transcript_16713/g.52265 Transcript_16713/m.52265 type:complete len:279 (-) Transcript_16713:199-1035(-)
MDIVEEVVSRRAFIGCAEQSVIVAAQAAGVDIVAVATMLQRTPMGLILRESLTTLNDVRSIGVHGAGRRALEMIKKSKGLDARLVDVDVGSKFDRVVAGDLDACQCYAVDEPIAIQRKYGLDAPPDVVDLGLDFAAQTLFVRRDLLRHRLVPAFLRATFDGWRLALKNKSKAARAVAAVSRLDVLHQTKLIHKLEPYVRGDIRDDALLGRVDPAAWFRAARILWRHRLLDAELEPPDDPDHGASWHYRPSDDDARPSIVFDRADAPGQPWWLRDDAAP